MFKYIIDKTDKGYVLKLYIDNKPVQAFHVSKYHEAVGIMERLMIHVSETDRLYTGACGDYAINTKLGAVS